MIELSGVRMPLDAGLPGREDLVRACAARALGVSEKEIVQLELVRRSVDARKKNQVHFTATLAVSLENARAERRVLEHPKTVERGVRVREHHPYEPLAMPHLACGTKHATAGGESPRPVVVGFGPAGMFAALYLARAGLRPLVIERGGSVEERQKAVARFDEGGPLDVQTNIQFGEGGAGTFSDGKLTTGTKSPFAQHVLHWFVEAGAPPEILWEAKPHIGTDKLVNVVRATREEVERLGGEVRFHAQLTGLEFEPEDREEAVSEPSCRLSSAMRKPDGYRPLAAQSSDAGRSLAARKPDDDRPIVAQPPLENRGSNPAERRLTALEVLDTRSGERTRFPACEIILACGHSARDTFELARAAGLLLKCKPFSVGVRIEHAQRAINRAQYGSAAGHPALGAADYKMAVHLPNGRSVYTFCMCPGGEVVCAASEEGGVVVNGMSRFARDGRNANAALLVGVEPSDFPGTDPLAGVAFQRSIERAAYAAALRSGGRPYSAPAQTVGDFLKKENGSASAGTHGAARSKHAVKPTYARGVAWCDLHECLPAFVSTALAAALTLFDRKLHGFADPQAVMTGVETRSSSPVRIVRDETFQALFAGAEESTPVRAAGLFPAGEGPGYAGGIMSAAVDGVRCAEALVKRRIAEAQGAVPCGK